MNRPPKSATGLYWSEQGEIACADHAPVYRSDTWRTQHWSALPAEALRLDPSCHCEHCRERATG